MRIAVCRRRPQRIWVAYLGKTQEQIFFLSAVMGFMTHDRAL